MSLGVADPHDVKEGRDESISSWGAALEHESKTPIIPKTKVLIRKSRRLTGREHDIVKQNDDGDDILNDTKAQDDDVDSVRENTK